MKSFVYQLQSPKTLVIREQVLNIHVVADDEIIAQTIYSVLSPGTEIAAWKGLPTLRASVTYPRLVGYCNLARVVHVGKRVSNMQEGDYILTHQSHRSAFICNQSEVLLCYKDLEETTCKSIAAAYLYHLGYAALLTGNYKPGLYVGIVGMGTLGLTTAELVKTYGTQPYIFTNQNNSDTLLYKYDFSNIFRKDLTCLQTIQDSCLMDGLDIIINTSNTWNDYWLSMQVARKGGEIICLGFPGRGELKPDFNPLDPQYFYDKQLSIKHTGYVTHMDLSPIDKRFTLKRNMHYLASLILQKKINPANILSMNVAWDNLELAYRTIEEKRGPVYSALIDWSSLCVQQ